MWARWLVSLRPSPFHLDCFNLPKLDPVVSHSKNKVSFTRPKVIDLLYFAQGYGVDGVFAIFNRDGNKYLNEYSNLYMHKFGVCKSVFLIFRQFRSNNVSITNSGTQCLAQF